MHLNRHIWKRHTWPEATLNMWPALSLKEGDFKTQWVTLFYLPRDCQILRVWQECVWLESSCTTGGKVKWSICPQRVKHSITRWPINFPLQIYPREPEAHTHTKPCLQMSKALLFIIAKTEEQHKCHQLLKRMENVVKPHKDILSSTLRQ